MVEQDTADTRATCHPFPDMRGANAALFQLMCMFVIPFGLHLATFGPTPLVWLSNLQQWYATAPQFVGNFLFALVTYAYLAIWIFIEIGPVSPLSVPMGASQRVLHTSGAIALLLFIASDTADAAWLDTLTLASVVLFHLAFWGGAFLAPRVVTRALHREVKWFLALSLVAVPLTGPLAGGEATMGVWKQWLETRGAPRLVERFTGSLHRLAARSVYVAAALTIENAGRPAAPTALFSVAALVTVAFETFDLYEAVSDVFVGGVVGVNLIMEVVVLLLISYALGASIAALSREVPQ